MGMPDLGAMATLRILELHRNRIPEVPEGFFEGLESLERLTLSNNELTALPASIAKAAKLSTILIDGNK